VLLLDRVPHRQQDGRLPPGVRIAGPGIALLRAEPALVARWRRRGHEVHVWTVNTTADLDLCRRLGVSLVISDRPGELLRALGR
jgi:glycerophosphoryl diester phosphodiesterase